MSTTVGGLNRRIKVTGFPRSGNTFLAYSAATILGIPSFLNIKHTVYALETTEIPCVPIRNPLDCIPSWNANFSEGTLQDDVAYYLRFHNAVLANLHRVVLMDFNEFTNDLGYVAKKLGVDYTGSENVADIEVKMREGLREWNLPRPGLHDMDSLREQLLSEPRIEECLNLYHSLVEKSPASKVVVQRNSSLRQTLGTLSN